MTSFHWRMCAMRRSARDFRAVIAFGVGLGAGALGHDYVSQAFAAPASPPPTLPGEPALPAVSYKRLPPPRRAEIPRPVEAPAPFRAFRNCAAARTAGATPLYRGEPGYAAHLDRDDDGIACEPYRRR